jgi:hypothetical protein
MPYITRDEREELESGRASSFKLSAGQINFLITRAIDVELSSRGVSYSVLNDIVGDLDMLQVRIAAGLSVRSDDSVQLQWMQWIIESWMSLSGATARDAVGVLGCVREELYRRVAAPYEDSKVMANGDVYTPRFFN